MDKIIFLHGFNSSGQCSKSDLLQYYLPQYKFITPNLPNSPTKCMRYIKTIIKQQYDNPYEKIHFIGCNLGSFYCLYFAEKYNLNTFLIDPVTNPYELLLNVTQRHFYCELNKNDSAHIRKKELDYIYSLENKLYSTNFYSNIEVSLNEDDIFFESAFSFFKDKNVELYHYSDPKNTTELVQKLYKEINKHFS
ncbi:hypothetical protein PBI_SCTP2_3 [Salicola phage SCTP-2]|nr:hypothetical protein PBI_SCTP2_3 [Salicola phage SCTP-2]